MDSEWQQVLSGPRTILNILTDLNNVLDFMVSILPQISYSVIFPMFKRLFRVHQLQLASLPPSCFTAIFSSLARLLLLFSLLDFFTSVLADVFSLEFEWQQVSISLQDSFHDSGRSQQCCHLDSLYPSANFQVLQDF